MAKKVKNLFKKLGRIYMEGAEMQYRPLIEAGINPFM